MKHWIENTYRLDVHALQRGGALVENAVTFWGWDNGEEGSLACKRGRLTWQGTIQCTIKYTWRTCNAGQGDFVRPHLYCPQCARGCYHLYYRNDAFMCRRHLAYRDQQLARAVRCYACTRIGRLRKRLSISPVYFTRMPRRKNKHERPRTDRLIAELKATERKVKAMLAREARYARS